MAKVWKCQRKDANIFDDEALLRCTGPYVSNLEVFLYLIGGVRWHDQVIREWVTTPNMLPEGHDHWEGMKGFCLNHESESWRLITMSSQLHRDASGRVQCITLQVTGYPSCVGPSLLVYPLYLVLLGIAASTSWSKERDRIWEYCESPYLELV